MWWTKRKSAADLRAEHILLQVRALVPAGLANDLAEKVLAGQLSLVDLKLGVYSMTDRAQVQALGAMTEKQLDHCTSPGMVSRIVQEQLRETLDLVARDHFLELQRERTGWERCGRL